MFARQSRDGWQAPGNEAPHLPRPKRRRFCHDRAAQHIEVDTAHFLVASADRTGTSLVPAIYEPETPDNPALVPPRRTLGPGHVTLGSRAASLARARVTAPEHPCDGSRELRRHVRSGPKTVVPPAMGIKPPDVAKSRQQQKARAPGSRNRSAPPCASRGVMSGRRDREACYVSDHRMEAISWPDRDARWHDRRADVDRCLEAIYGKEAQARDQGRRTPQGCVGRADTVPDADGDPWPEPVDFLAAGDLVGAPELRANHLPEALYPFVMDTAARMGVDPASVALATLVACASVADDHWQLQPKRDHDTWTESPRLWGGILGDPSVLKTPVIRACTKPLDLLDADARRRHAEDMRRHQAEMSAWKVAGGDPAPLPVTPLLDRYLVEGTTIEALSEALRSDSEAKQARTCWQSAAAAGRDVRMDRRFRPLSDELAYGEAASADAIDTVLSPVL